jgi:hypothetical protein
MATVAPEQDMPETDNPPLGKGEAPASSGAKTADIAPATPPILPSIDPRPPHSRTESTLAPTSEFTRLLLLALTSRYGLRGMAKLLHPSNSPLYNRIYSLGMGIGSTILSLKYNSLVKHDMRNIYCETVAYEKGCKPEEVTFADLKQSDNRIVKDTVDNYRRQSFKRLGSDALFFLTLPLFSSKKLLALHGAGKFDFEAIPDFLIGTKAGIGLVETWNRKTTIFEDLVTFINHKINPRSGLGQPITVGEIFDLYQHYSSDFHPDRMFQDRRLVNPEEGKQWARVQPVFQRIADLMNHSYAFKHKVSENDNGLPDADFPLPKLIYLMGHDLIQPRHPEQTLLAIEIANQYGIEKGVKPMQKMMAEGVSLDEIARRYPITLAPWRQDESKEENPNKVIAKGPTMNLDAAPSAVIDRASLSITQLATQATQRVS